MKQLHFFAMTVITTVVASMAHAWCYEETFLGGHLPFALTVLAPIVACWIGFRAGRHEEFQTNLEAGIFTRQR